jgi:hypothetical protein
MTQQPEGNNNTDCQCSCTSAAAIKANTESINFLTALIARAERRFEDRQDWTDHRVEFDLIYYKKELERQAALFERRDAVLNKFIPTITNLERHVYGN